MVTEKKKRSFRRYMGALATIVVISTLGYLGGRQGSGVPPSVASMRLSLAVSRDVGALPARGTGTGQWCGAIGGLSAPLHCYVTGVSGALTDYGTAGKTLNVVSTIARPVVPVALPVTTSTGGVSWTAENVSFQDGAGYWIAYGNDIPSTRAVSVTILELSSADGRPESVFELSSADILTHFVFVRALASDGLRVSVKDGTSPAKANVVRTSRQGWQCTTVVIDTSGANLGYAYNNGVYAGPFDFAQVNPHIVTGGHIRIGGGTQGYMKAGAVARVRVEPYGAKLTEAQHLAICGSFGTPLRANHAAVADSTYTHTGNARCFAMGDHTATCLPGGTVGVTWDGTRLAYAPERSRTNRLNNNAALWNWTVEGNPELINDGDMEAADTSAYTARSAGSTTLTKETTSPHGGTRNLRATRGDGSISPGAFQTVATVGKYYQYSVWYRSDGTAYPNFAATCGSSTSPCTGTLSTSWQYCSAPFLANSQSPCLWGTNTAGTYTEYDDISVMLHGTPVVAPDGSLTAYQTEAYTTITSPVVSGYTVSATLYPRVWVKCATGDVAGIALQTGTGEWAIDCSHTSIAGQWALIHRDHPAVLVNTEFASDESGNAQLYMIGLGPTSWWLPTITEVPGYSVIPVGATGTATTGNADWVFDNSLGKYWLGTDKVILAGSTLDGTCLDLDSTITLTGGISTECTGTIESITILRP